MKYKKIGKITALLMGTIFFVTMICSFTTKKTNDSFQRQEQNQDELRKRKMPTTRQIMDKMDSNKDGKLSKEEVKGPLANDFSKVDSNKDGYISKEELDKAPKPKRAMPPK